MSRSRSLSTSSWTSSSGPRAHFCEEYEFDDDDRPAASATFLQLEAVQSCAGPSEQDDAMPLDIMNAPLRSASHCSSKSKFASMTAAKLNAAVVEGGAGQ